MPESKTRIAGGVATSGLDPLDQAAKKQ
jgi:hypothetical protein